MQYEILVLDLDGTLTNNKKEITPHTKEVLRAYQEAGGTIVLASGRPTYGVVPLAEELELKKYHGYMLSFNGALITDCSTGELIFETWLPAGVPQQMADLAQQYRTALLTYQGDDILTETPDTENPIVLFSVCSCSGWTEITQQYRADGSASSGYTGHTDRSQEGNCFLSGLWELPDRTEAWEKHCNDCGLRKNRRDCPGCPVLQKVRCHPICRFRFFPERYPYGRSLQAEESRYRKTYTGTTDRSIQIPLSAVV